MKKLLIIAGSDSGGGAGIQADIKTACAHGVFATTAITAVTAQNTIGVQAIHDIPAEFVGKQIDAVLNDIGADAIKIGMLNNAEVIEAVAAKLTSVTCPIVLDTVMVSSSGDRLLEDNAIQTLKTKLIPLATLVTPNIPEAEMLGDISATAAAILLKGGHMQGNKVVDTLIHQNQKLEIRNSKLETNNTHGTGCTLASAIACNLANGLELTEAVKKACAYVRKAIETAPDIGTGKNKPLNHTINY